MNNFSRVAFLRWLEPFYLLGLAVPILLPGRIIPSSLHFALLPLLFLFPIVRAVRGRVVRLDTPRHLPIFLLLLLLPISFWASADRATSTIAAGYLLLGIALYFALINWPPVCRNPLRFAHGLAIVGVALAIVAPFVTAWKVEFRLFRFPAYDLLRSLSLESLLGFGETIHANVLAGTLVLFLPIVAILAIDKLQSSERLKSNVRAGGFWLWAIGFLLVAVAIVLTQSRGGYLAALVSVALVVCLASGVRLRTVLLFGALIGAIGFLLLYYMIDPIAVFNVIATDSALGGAEFRVDVWSNSLYAITDFPFTGIGIGTFNQVVPHYYPFAFVNGAYAEHAHNLYLQIALDLGVLGLVAYVVWIIIQLWMIVDARRAEGNSVARLPSIAVLGSLTALLIHGLLDSVTWGTKLAFFPWIIFALVTVLHRCTMQPKIDGERFVSDDTSS